MGLGLGLRLGFGLGLATCTVAFALSASRAASRCGEARRLKKPEPRGDADAAVLLLKPDVAAPRSASSTSSPVRAAALLLSRREKKPEPHLGRSIGIFSEASSSFLAEPCRP